MCTVTKKKEMLFLMYASILQKYYMDNLPSVMQHKKKKKHKKFQQINSFFLNDWSIF